MRHSRDRVQSAEAPRAIALGRRLGAGLAEYVLLIALIAVGLVMILVQFRNQPGRILDESSTTMGGNRIPSYGEPATSGTASGSNGSANGLGNGNGGGNGNGNNGIGNGNGGSNR